ncbi:MAG: protein-disulfide reductase DsbD [Gammaproteobacteria bacterium]|nr:protein-disulfide reductase DsbD [Gammaproteobacteria bacterium]
MTLHNKMIDRSKTIATIGAALLGLVAVAACAQSIGERLQNLVSPTGNDLSSFGILDPDQAFRLSATPLGAGAVRFDWVIEEGYYLYRDKFSFASLTDGVSVEGPAVRVPRGTVKQDESFGRVEVHTGQVAVDVPLRHTRAGIATALLQVGYQGCKDESVCYPPQLQQLSVTLEGVAGATLQPVSPGRLSVQDRITTRLKQGSFILNVLAFFTFGVLLSLTPCVFPMIPILSGIIVGRSGTVSARRGLALSLAYVLAMALTYALLGVLAGSFQFNLQAASQNVWVIGAFSLVFVLLALSMFGFYELRLPSALHTRLASLSAAPGNNGLYSCALMGAVSAVIVGPCVAPPLAGALLYISQTGDALLGGAALFAMGLGFGVPLLIIGASAGSLLPRVGAWMEKVKQGFGVIMLGVAIWFLARVIPGNIAMLLWALLIILAALLLGAANRSAANRSDPNRSGPVGKALRAISIVGFIYAGALIIGALSGSQDMLRPLAHLTGTPAVNSSLDFRRIKSGADLDAELATAGAAGKLVMLDFYADWCITCIEMEEDTFSEPAVQQALSGVVLLRADVTRNDAEDQRLLKRFQIFGPPAVLFFNSDGQELPAYRLVGYVKPEQFLQHLERVLDAS